MTWGGGAWTACWCSYLVSLCSKNQRRSSRSSCTGQRQRSGERLAGAERPTRLARHAPRTPRADSDHTPQRTGHRRGETSSSVKSIPLPLSCDFLRKTYGGGGERQRRFVTCHVMSCSCSCSCSCHSCAKSYFVFTRRPRPRCEMHATSASRRRLPTVGTDAVRIHRAPLCRCDHLSPPPRCTLPPKLPPPPPPPPPLRRARAGSLRQRG